MVCVACSGCDVAFGKFVPLISPKFAPDRQTQTILAFMRYAITSLLLLHLLAGSSPADDWMTLPSTYSHDETGQRVTQYQPIAAPAAPGVSNFRTSGYTHTRSSLNYGQSADNYHRVEEWGDPVRPYGEWRFPYRPFSTPYQNWGAPYAGLNLGVGFGGGYGNGFPNGGRGNGGYGRPGNGPGGRPGGPGGGVGPGPGGPGNGGPGNGIRFPRSQYDPINPDGIFRERQDRFGRPSDPNLFQPYPSGPGTPYPVAPYYDGYHPVYRD